LGDLGATYDDHLRLVGKRIVLQSSAIVLWSWHSAKMYHCIHSFIYNEIRVTLSQWKPLQGTIQH